MSSSISNELKAAEEGQAGLMKTPADKTPKRSWRNRLFRPDKITKRARRKRLLVIVQLLGFAAAITFGVWAPLSYAISQRALDQQGIGNNMTLAGLEEQRYARALSEESNRWSKYAYDLELAALQADLILNCQTPNNNPACETVKTWNKLNQLQSIVDTYSPERPSPILNYPIIPPPVTFTPKGYPLSSKAITEHTETYILSAVVAISYLGIGALVALLVLVGLL